MSKEPIVDAHVHLTPYRFQKAIQSGNDWYGMTKKDGELDNPKNLWSPERRIEEMNRLGIDKQLVSPTDCFYQYNREPEITAKIAEECNTEISELVHDYPEHYMGLGTLPMQDVELAKELMRKGVKKLGLKGFMIDDHVNGLTYDETVFDSFWAEAERLGAFILVHQYGPTVVEYRTRRYFLHNTVGNLVDRTLTYGCLIGGGVMDRYPKLKICLGHAGGYVPYAADRMDKGWEMFPGYRGESRHPPSGYLDKFIYDTATFTDRNLRFLVDSVGVENVVLGTDWPAPMVVDNPVQRIRQSKLFADDEKEKILSGNIARILSA
jgi:aminocarboxymuconate-semialdehyde decarboxylase